MSIDDKSIVDNAVAQAGAYEVIRKRLDEQGKSLNTLTKALNDQRLTEFGGVEMHTIGRTRVRTENNCIARDIVQVGDKLLFGYNVFIGLKKETKIEDVFALFELKTEGDTHSLVEFNTQDSFLYDQRFKGDFDELYRYYKEARLIKLALKGGRLLAAFQIGDRTTDQRVFRWSVSADGNQFEYIDNRGERDIELPDQYDFEWIETGRDDFVHGQHAHVNIADKVFVETIGGDLTIKVENNTEDGLGIYAEAVQEENQSLDDGQVSYALVGKLVLLAITPYKEEQTRYFVFNTLTESVTRIDAIGHSCVQLPEDHGVIFPGGYYLETGETKSFTDNIEGLHFEKMIRSPNGEDVLYIFYEGVEGRVALFSYNLISKTLQNPIFSHGYALYENGKLVIFSAEEEATRVHPMQFWQTSYISTEYASQQPESSSALGKIGNSELVRGISNLYSIVQLINGDEVSMRHYEELNSATSKIFDSHYWLEDEDNQAIAKNLRLITDTAELVVDEFEKVESIQQQSTKALKEAKNKQKSILSAIATTTWETAEQFITSIASLRQQRGHIATIKTYRYINVEELEELGVGLVSAEEDLGKQTVDFLANEDSLSSYTERVEEYANELTSASTNSEIRPLITNIEETTAGLDLLSELITTLKIDDTTIRTRIVDTISEVYAKLNQTKARSIQKQKSLGSEEAIAQFSAQFKLFSQSITNALSIADTPEKCDEQLARLLLQLEDLESQFTDFDQFLADILEKREEIYESFEAHKQSLVETRQRRAQTLSDSASRILNSIEKRSLKLADADQLNTYFASDTLVLKTTELVAQLRDLDAQVAADDLLSRFKGVKEQAIRSLRDKNDIYEEGGKVIKLGPKHKFSVNQQELDLTIIPRNDQLYFHLIGTDYYELVTDSTLAQSKHFWSMSLESETSTVYRGEYLAYLVINAAKSEQEGLTFSDLQKASKDIEILTKLVRDFSTPLYKHGYQKGIHDSDAALILQAVIPAINHAELLCYEPLPRGFAQLFWANLDLLADVNGTELTNIWQQQAISAMSLQTLFANGNAVKILSDQIQKHIIQFDLQYEFGLEQIDQTRAANYLLEQIAVNSKEFSQSKYSHELITHFEKIVDTKSKQQLTQSLSQLKDQPKQQWALCRAWLTAVADQQKLTKLQRYIPEAAANMVANLALDTSTIELELTVTELLGEHQIIEQQTLNISLDDYLQRMEHHHTVSLPDYHHYLDLRNESIKLERSKLKLESFKAKPLSSFVRNRLVNESYLPLIGDNLAKQMGTVGDSKRTDLMGLLMMISPPGYGKTTLMEYVANRLGLIFMKINCPALGHDVVSLDPEQAPNSTARQEIEKINLAFEMGNNVMLYLDDIQHTHPEFLQKYISLCDGTRRVEGVWRGEAKTYDMRGKKFCVVMAGNPYTESGEVFKVPDMLANRADIYNLGDILGGMDEQFALSYIENALTSNSVLAPMATREMGDVYHLVAMAKGDNVATTELSHQYSSAEINEISNVFKKLFVIQELILKVNQQYIASAAQADKYRIEPPFKLQGSYRNMNKMAEKVSAVMNNDELMQLIEDHYLGESQLLTNGTEENLLKLAELRGNMTADQTARWQQIKDDFKRTKALGGDDSDSGYKIANQMINLVDGLEQLKTSLETNNVDVAKKSHATSQANATQSEEKHKQQAKQYQLLLDSLNAISQALETQVAPSVEIVNQPSQQMIDTLDTMASAMETSISPLILSMEKKMDIDLRTLDRINELTTRIESIKTNAALLKKPTKTVKRKPKAEKEDSLSENKSSSDSKRF